MKYSVLLKPKVMLRIDGIEAGSQKEAALKALAQYESNMYDLMSRDLGKFNPKDPAGTFRYMEQSESEMNIEALVDEEGDEDFEKSEWYIIVDDREESIIPDTMELQAAVNAVYNKQVAVVNDKKHCSFDDGHAVEVNDELCEKDE